MHTITSSKLLSKLKLNYATEAKAEAENHLLKVH